MDFNWATWIPSGAAVAAAVVAVWQAVSARSQAKSAKDAAATAERQARAAEDQLALARRQFQVELSARDEADGPTFEVGPGVVHGLHEVYAEVQVKLLSGKYLGAVVVSVPGQPNVRGFVKKVGGDYDELAQVKTLQDLAPRRTFTLVLMLEYEAVVPMNVLFDFECHEGDGTRTWRRAYTSLVDVPPTESVSDKIERSGRLFDL